MTTVSLRTTQYRLARHYLNKLHSADMAVRRGQVSAAYGLTLFDQEWEQIRLWQVWAAKRERHDKEKARLCKEFPLAGLEILAIRNNAEEHADWLLTALEAARQLGDHEAERTLCYELLMTYYRLGMPEKIESFARELLQVAEAASDSLSIERALFGLGLVAEERGMFAEAESYYHRALQLSQELGIDTEVGHVLNSLGSVATYAGDYQKAYPYFLRQLELVEKTGKKSEVCHALLSMGGLLLWQKDYAGAEGYLQRAVAMSQALGLRRLLGVSLIHLGASALEQNQLEAAKRYLEDGLEAVRNIGIVRQIMNGLNLLGYTWLRMGDPSAALVHLQEGLKMARESQSTRNIFNLQSSLAKTYFVLNDLDSALTALKEVVALAQRLGGYPQKVEAVSIAVAYFQRLGLNEQATVWTGTIFGDSELDQAFVMPIFLKLETSLGIEAYQRLLDQGKSLTLEEVVSDVIAQLKHHEIG